MNKYCCVLLVSSVLSLFSACKKVDDGEYLATFNCGHKDFTGYPLDYCSTSNELYLNLMRSSDNSFTVVYSNTSGTNELQTFDKDSIEGNVSISSVLNGPGFYSAPYIKGTYSKSWGKTIIEGVWTGFLSTSEFVSGDFILEEQ